MQPLRLACETGILRALLAITPRLPRGLTLGLGSSIGRLAFALDRRHRRITLENLELALGDQFDAPARATIARAAWRNLGRNLVESLRFSRFGPESVGSLVHYEGLEHIRAAYERGQGVLQFSGHFGHWELAALMQGYLGLPLLLMARPLDNPSLEQLLATLREQSGNQVVHKRNAMREVLRAVQQGIGVAILIDQDMRHHGIFVPFFGRPASTTPMLARVALRSGAAIVPTFCIPREQGGYQVIYEAPLVVEPRGRTDQDIAALTEQCTAILERWIRRYPQFWFWMHRRWKTTPPEIG